MNRCVAVVFDPAASVAVTAIAAVPAARGRTVNSEPDTDTAATPAGDDTAAYVRTSRSPSRNAAARSIATAPSSIRSVRSASVPSAAGPSFGTVTVNRCVAVVFDPAASVAVTAIAAVPSSTPGPAATGVSVTVVPATVAATTAGADDATP